MRSSQATPRALASPAVLGLALALALGLAGALPAATSAPSPAPSSSPSPPVLQEDGADFVRLGQATFRWKNILKVYDIALHLGTGQEASRALADVPMRLELVYHRSFTAAEIIKGGDELLRRNVDAAALNSIAPRLAELNRAYANVKPGDIYALTYVPGRGTTLRLNGNPLATIPGYDFAASYFRIWLGREPMSAGLRDELLGR